MQISHVQRATMMNHNEAYRQFLMRLIEARIRTGLSQGGVAQLLGFDAGISICRREKGYIRVTVDELLELASLYHVPECWLLKGDVTE